MTWMLQQTYNKIARHLLTQGKQALSADNCSYLDYDGNTCAVGCLIPRHEYNPTMEGCSFRTMLPWDLSYTRDRFSPTIADLCFYPGMQTFLREAQSVHDSDSTWDSQEDLFFALQQLASDFNLTPINEA